MDLTLKNLSWPVWDPEHSPWNRPRSHLLSLLPDLQVPLTDQPSVWTPMGALSHLCPIQCLPQGAGPPPRDAFSQKGRRNSGFSAAPQLPVLLAWAVGFHHILALSWDPHQAEIPDPKGLRAFRKQPAPGNVEGLPRGSYPPALAASFPLCLALLPPLPNWFHASLHCSVVLHPSHPPGPP